MTTHDDTLRRRLRGEEGSALLTAMVLLTIMVSTSLALLSYVDTETKQSGVGRTRETVFNLAEAAMNAQVFTLANQWPGDASVPFATCAPATGGSKCPGDAQLRGMFPTADVDPAMQWSTRVIDNQAPYDDFYAEAMLSSTTYGYDHNGDGEVWIRASATSRGRSRTLVALVRAEEQVEDIASMAVLAGRLSISNKGNKTIIDANPGGRVEVRCNVNNGTCLGHSLGSGKPKTEADLKALLDVQITPNLSSDDSTTSGMSVETALRLRSSAQAKGTYYTSCPSSLTGKVVWLENLNCSYTGGTHNGSAQPGVVILNGGSLSLGGNATYNGVVYYTDLDGVGTIPSSNVVSLGGTSMIRGGVIVEGAGIVQAGSSGTNIDYDANAFAQIKSIATAGIVENTWRELTPN